MICCSKRKEKNWAATSSYVSSLVAIEEPCLSPPVGGLRGAHKKIATGGLTIHQCRIHLPELLRILTDLLMKIPHESTNEDLYTNFPSILDAHLSYDQKDIWVTNLLFKKKRKKLKTNVATRTNF